VIFLKESTNIIVIMIFEVVKKDKQTSRNTRLLKQNRTQLLKPTSRAIS